MRKSLFVASDGRVEDDLDLSLDRSPARLVKECKLAIMAMMTMMTMITMMSMPLPPQP